jgi:LDH2 family malate/lactate/ureidoglycolate dehydrogenase
MTINYIVPAKTHNDLVAAAYRHRGFHADEADAAARFSELTALHGIKTHNAIKALHLDELFGSKAGGCKPGATIEKLPSKYKAVEKWNANRKLGQATAYLAMETAMKLADEFGVGVVAVDNAFHYLWGGGYVIEAAKKGYIAYTACTAALAEVVPFGGTVPTLGTNPHSWAFPTQDIVGFPICIDWATSTIAMGRVQQLLREGKPLPPGSAVDENGKETIDPAKVKANTKVTASP